MKRLLLLILISSLYLFANIKNVENEKNLKEKINTLEKPLYTPFVENYILNEIKQLREENRDLKVELHKTLAKKEIEMSSNVINYATSTINNMFYIIAAASSILVIIGWSSIKDINDKIKNMVDEKTSKTIQKYEEKMAGFEQDLAKRARQVKHNENEIKIMNTIHSLWLRASQETTPTGKIEAYDEILDIRPNEVEALIYKADAVLDIGEANWSLNLVNQALLIDKNYPSAYFQRAKAYAVLEYEDSAIDDLQKAIQLNEEYATKIETEEEFEGILKNERVKQIVV
ncbi:tetratricopeptide repeat protein [Arcobacter arenosus]|jgi:tetratricopeptide (TPR) repeat protein|uniref:Tetratricopeptide repeat protein n=1 Tax=Arcobacter arenosus TaxID=2576037 RepID=A0A5R8XXP7_9BACT|nr:tetratricopeptide repeat protein [Arcobacter arenosus]TLP36194.1 tetratricopeptide repeat protein [Arcobacter arenosus]